LIRILIFDTDATIIQIQTQLNDLIEENGGDENLKSIQCVSQNNRDLNGSSRIIYTLQFQEDKN